MSDRSQAIETLMSVGGVTKERAMFFLEASNWDVNLALDQILSETEIAEETQPTHETQKPTNEPPRMTRQPSLGSTTNPSSAVGMEKKVPIMTPTKSKESQKPTSSMSGNPVTIDYTRNFENEMKLMNAQSFPRKDSKTSAPSNLADIFAPPISIMFRRGFQAAKDVGAFDGKWLCVHLHKRDDFNSQRLNRDTWSNQEVQEILPSMYLFLQINHDEEDGAYISVFYQVKKFPWVGIIDPRTGQLRKVITGFREPFEMLDVLTEFAEQNKLEKFRIAPSPVARVATPNVELVKTAPSPSPTPQPQTNPVIISSSQPLTPAPMKQEPTKLLRPIPTQPEERKSKDGAPCLLQIRLPDGSAVRVTFSENDKLVDVHNYVSEFYDPAEGFCLIVNAPRKEFPKEEFEKTLKDAGLCPRAALFIRPSV
eukprot:TRINITY_DN5733_c0_g1_i7.p1 TRINITY_DN5733_c0_g1~~TRINITY_DN5733_c0_g1_i7.p1  ORF type:complete len:424 (-),score=87.70 TRINITY_DN5733_c0_g1_i7:214-1485(-)